VKVKQAALQALFNVEEVPVERPEGFPDEVGERVLEMADHLLRPDVMGEPAMAALATCAFEALLATRYRRNDALLLADRIASLPRDGVRRAALRGLERLEDHWLDDESKVYLGQVRACLKK